MANPPTGRLDVHTPQTRKEDCTLSYWWVNQGENFERAIKAHTLWTLQDRGGIWSSGRKEIFELRPGDIVIHHARKAIRAVSQFAEAATSATRPAENPPRPGESWSDVGQRVELDILHPVTIPQTQYATFISHGSGTTGPLGVDGIAKRRYLEQIDTRTAHAILAACGVEAPDLAPLPSAWADGIDATDSEALTKARLEQSKLRAFLLGTSPTATCDLCGRILPIDLIVAAHIQLRSKLTDQQRLQFKAVAMLACTLGCDALYEAGYITVNSNGIVTAGKPPLTQALSKAVTGLAGRTCPRHNHLTAAHFAARHDSLMTGWEGTSPD